MFKKRVMLEYLQVMISREDWHGVADAAMDLRDMSVAEEYEKKLSEEEVDFK